MFDFTFRCQREFGRFAIGFEIQVVWGYHTGVSVDNFNQKRGSYQRN